MTTQNGHDSHLKDGRWEQVDVLADCPDGGAVGDFLKSRGWEEFLSVGDELGPLVVQSWRRIADGKSQYMLSVSDEAQVSPFTVVDSFPELMDLFAKWAPAVQAASIAQVVSDLSSPGMGDGGIVERVAARAVYGTNELHDQLRSDMHREAALRRERRREREQQS